MAFGQYIRRAKAEKDGRAVTCNGTLCQSCGALRVAGKNGKLPPHRCLQVSVPVERRK
jgi:hypothetical protein